LFDLLAHHTACLPACSMSLKALQTRIRRIRNSDKMRSFIRVGSEGCDESLVLNDGWHRHTSCAAASTAAG